MLDAIEAFLLYRVHERSIRDKRYGRVAMKRVQAQDFQVSTDSTSISRTPCRLQECLQACGVRTRACRVETRLDAWLSARDS